MPPSTTASHVPSTVAEMTRDTQESGALCRKQGEARLMGRPCTTGASMIKRSLRTGACVPYCTISAASALRHLPGRLYPW